MSPIALVRMILLFGELRDCDSLHSFLTHPPHCEQCGFSWHTSSPSLQPVVGVQLINKATFCTFVLLLEPAGVATHTPHLFVFNAAG